MLSLFCTELTGITQDMVEGEDAFDQVLVDFNAWLEKELLPNSKFTFVTCGDWDLKTMLSAQCSDVGVNVPDHCRRWINIKKPFHQSTGLGYPKGMNHMLTGLGMQFEGRPHSGIDDSENIARILKQLALRGYVFENTFVPSSL
jgi:ERI1 exoribonuclease 3